MFGMPKPVRMRSQMSSSCRVRSSVRGATGLVTTMLPMAPLLLNEPGST